MTEKLPHLVFHLGQDKTGSTAIQRALARSTTDLEAAHIHFPDPGKHANHQILMPALSGRLPEDPVQMQTLARSEHVAWKAAEASWRKLRARFDEEAGIKRVIVSSEIEFRPWREREIRHLIQTIDGIIGSVEVVAYLRAPASYMMSVAQQDLKKRPRFRPIAADRYRACLEPFLRFGPGPVRAIAFDRETLHGGDVVRDFTARFLPGLASDVIAARAEHDNESISAEAISILQDYFRGKIAAPDRWHAARPQRFKRLVMAADAAVDGYRKPRLKAGLAEMAVARATDLEWLAETLGVDFTDGSVTMSRSRAEELYQSLEDIEDLTEVLPDRRAALLENMQRRARAARPAFWRVFSFGRR